ncbi:MAG: GH92 family glycosyl hydrolase [Bacteroidales bacterium]|nr:GH92 family glycosyl hydrolase [Bacteroidales bacterium]
MKRNFIYVILFFSVVALPASANNLVLTECSNMLSGEGINMIPDGGVNMLPYESINMIPDGGVNMLPYECSNMLLYEGSNRIPASGEKDIKAELDKINYVNSFVGTDLHGHTFPGATYPFGMVQLSPDTRIDGWDGCSGYHYSDSLVYGFSHTHLSGTGCSDYGDILIMPVVDYKYEDINNEFYRSHFRHEKEKASPGYYEVYLDKWNVLAQLTAGKRIGMHKYTFKEGVNPQLIIDLKHRDLVVDSYIELVGKNAVQGFRRSKAWASDQIVYFYIEFSKEIHRAEINNKNVGSKDKSSEYNSSTAILTFRNHSEKKSINNTTGISTSKSIDNTTGSLTSNLVDKTSGISTSKSVGNTIGNLSSKSNGKIICNSFNKTADVENVIYAKIGISSVSVKNAKMNLEAEISDWNFDGLRKNTEKAWNDYLSKIEVTTDNIENKKVFYTALYHTAISPNLYSDINGEYRGIDREVHKAEGYDQYTVFSLWDTYRALHPLFTIIEGKRTMDFIKSFFAIYSQAGKLPIWELSGNETNCMIGYHSIPVIADALAKGIDNFDLNYALEAMVASSNREEFGIDVFRDNGLVLAEKEHESISKTLEYAYDDWCIAQVAKKLGRDNIYKEYIRRAQYYKNIFDPSTGFMRPKIKGIWLDPFNPTEVNVHFTEANSWQYSFYVPQDVSGHINLFSEGIFKRGKNSSESGNNNLLIEKKGDICIAEKDAIRVAEKGDICVAEKVAIGVAKKEAICVEEKDDIVVEKKEDILKIDNNSVEAIPGEENYSKRLDELFSDSSRITGWNSVDITGMIGQYAQGNEPSHHIAYLYPYVGKPWKTQKLVRRIMTTLFTSAPDGLCGNEDCGQMSAWYVFSALGFYPVTPATQTYVLGSPMFQKAVINLEDGKQFTINAKENNVKNIYVQSVYMNGANYPKSYVLHSDIMEGSTIELNMGENPNYEFGKAYINRPHSSIIEELDMAGKNNGEFNVVTNPWFEIKNSIFTDSVKVIISSLNPEYEIWYCISEIGQRENDDFVIYSGPFTIKESSEIKAYCKDHNSEKSFITATSLNKVSNTYSIQIISKYSLQYAAGGDKGLIDGVRGEKNFRLGGWQGYQGTDLEAIIDLNEVKKITSISAGFLQDVKSWIWMPQYVEFFISEDGIKFKSAGVVKHNVDPKDYKPQIHDLSVGLPVQDTANGIRYIKVFAKKIGTIPNWHLGAGGEGYIFIDEIEIK